jgi:TonB-linked SusC/RagA family outer membrane protein
MKLKTNGIITLLFVFILHFSFAQQKTISGTVTDESGVLAGVNVFVKGTTQGTQTDFNGKYSLTANIGDVIVFSYTGRNSVEKIIGNSNVVDATLTFESLEEVTVVAYGSQTSKSIVGAVGVVRSNVIEKQQVTSFTTALQGSIPGVNVINSGGQPGNNASIRIRGTGSFNASNNPLIVVDGAAFSANLNTISPDQIESLTVLKDASATALYGSRGANGVILITTKKGRIGSPTKVSVRSTIGFADQAADHHDFLDADTYMKYTWEAIRNANQYVGGESPAEAGTNASNNLISTLGYNPYGIANPIDASGNLVSSNKLWETDWASHLLDKSAVRHDHSLSVSGGSNNTSYYIAANYLDQEGSIQTSTFERISTRINLNTKINKWLNMGMNTAYSTSKQNYPIQSGTNFQSATQWLITIPSIFPLYQRDNEGNLVLDGLGNPIYDYGDTAGQANNGSRPLFVGENAVGALYNNKYARDRHNFTTNAYVKINITNNISLNTKLSYENYTFDINNYSHSEVGVAANVDGRVRNDRDITTTINLINQVNYTNSFGNHHIKVDAIHEAYKFKLSTLGARGIGFLPNVTVLSGSTNPESVSGDLSEERLESYLGRISYNYQNRYFIEGSFRTDGSTKFHKDVRWGNFFSLGGAWIVSDEPFFDLDFINFFKLKASFGESGNNKGIGYFPYLQQFLTGWNQLDNPGVLLGFVTDPLLSWEKSRSTNFGVELRFLNNKFSTIIDYYNSESIDLIYNKPIAPSTGNRNIRTNVGAIRNHGVEVTLNSKNLQSSKIEWTTALNFSLDRNEILELTQDGFINGTKRWEEGRSLFEFYIKEYAGVNPDNGYAMWNKDVLDTNGNPTGDKETTESYSNATRYYVDKSSLPDVIGGLTNEFRFGLFDLNLLLNFSFGSYVYDGTYAQLMSGFKNPGSSASPDLKDRWQNPGDITDIPLLLQSNNNFNGLSDRFLFRNDYVRLKALNIGYHIPSKLVKKYRYNS